jgi:hypothetical protein
LIRYLETFVNDSGVESHVIQTVLKRFIVRHIAIFDASKQDLDLKQPLFQFVFEPSLWPDQVKKNADNPQHLEKMAGMFPKMLNLSHSYYVFEFLKNEAFKDRRREKWMTETSSKNTGLRRQPQRAPGRARSKFQMGNT